MKFFSSRLAVIATLVLAMSRVQADPKYNVLFIISDDLTATALSCYGNKVCQTPNIDAIAEQGVRYTKAFCQGTCLLYTSPSPRD